MSNATTDLASVIVQICHQMCDIAHVLSRCTTIPTPDNEEHKEEIKAGISGSYSNLQQLRATVLSLGDVAGFDTTEIKPRTDVPDEVQEKINTITGLMRDLPVEEEVVEEEVDEETMDTDPVSETTNEFSRLLDELNRRKADDDNGDDDEAADAG